MLSQNTTLTVSIWVIFQSDLTNDKSTSGSEAIHGEDLNLTCPVTCTLRRAATLVKDRKVEDLSLIKLYLPMYITPAISNKLGELSLLSVKTIAIF